MCISEIFICVKCRVVAGGGEESQQQPRWGPGGELYFVSDRSGWWNLYKEEEEGKVRERGGGEGGMAKESGRGKGVCSFLNFCKEEEEGKVREN